MDKMSISEDKKTITLACGAHELDVVRADGTQFNWQYDVVTIKLLIERLEVQHGVRTPEGVTGPTNELLDDLATKLFEGCTRAVAYSIYYLVYEQFAELNRDLKAVLDQISSKV